MTYHRIYNRNNAMGATYWARTVYPSRTPEFTPDFSGVCLSVLFLLTIVLSVLWFMASDYPLLSSLFCYLWTCMSLLFSFNDCINCPSMYGFWLLFWCLQTFKFVDLSLSFFFWPLHCLPFDLQLLISPLVSSNFLLITFALDEFP